MNADNIPSERANSPKLVSYIVRQAETVNEKQKKNKKNLRKYIWSAGVFALALAIVFGWYGLGKRHQHMSQRKEEQQNLL